MGFKECIEAMPPSIFFSLEKDKDSEIVFFYEEPFPISTKLQGVEKIRYAFPVVTEVGLCFWTVGVKMFKRLRDNWKTFGNKPVLITRYGDKGDTSTHYDLQVAELPEGVQAVLATITPDEYHAAVKACVDVAARSEDE
jgi:hypothetical protein